MIPKQLNLPFDNSNVDNANLIDYDSPVVAPVQHKIKRVETDYEKMENGTVRVKTSEFVYLKDGRIITAHTTEILD
jgi:hypothetical protein|tara:strand:- start:228 stop:455 length:228 start_codon:yes stop_codon:yes gene_type:complete